MYTHLKHTFAMYIYTHIYILVNETTYTLTLVIELQEFVLKNMLLYDISIYFQYMDNT